MCGSKINEGKCSCGTWINAEEMENNPLKLALDQFNEMRRFTMTGDAPHLGCAFVFFRGDYNDTKKVEKYIYEMKKRPFYEEG